MHEVKAPDTSRASLLFELKACSISRDLTRGKNIHERAIQNGHGSDFTVANALINMYGKCGHYENARDVFDDMPVHSVVSWTALLLGYVDSGEAVTALELFCKMELDGCPPDARAFVVALKACATLATSEHETSSERGMAVHLLASCSGCDSSIFVENILVDMYGKCGCVEHALAVFNRMRFRDVVTWTALILGYVGNGEGRKALCWFARMQREGFSTDARTFVGALKACTDLIVKGGEEYHIQLGKAVHMLASCKGYDKNVFVESILVDLYAKSGSLDDSKRIFDSIRHPDLVSWNALLSGYAENGKAEMALDVFSRLECTPDGKTFVSALKALEHHRSTSSTLLERAKALHFLSMSYGRDSDFQLCSTLLDIYVRCGSMEDAQRVFEKMENCDVKFWTVLIVGHVETGNNFAALELFSKMEREVPDARTFVAVLKACTNLAVKEQTRSRERGRLLHLLALMAGFHSNMFMQCTLLDLYAKCGKMTDAQNVFDSITNPDVVSWNALILGYAENGEADFALKLYSSMKETLEPDAGTFLAVLKACSILGSLELGKSIHSEIRSCGLEQNAAVATCLMDFYAKCGSLVDAEHVFKLHATKDLVTWNALMAGYGRLGDTGGMFQLFERLDLVPDGSTFSNILTVCSHSGLVEKGMYYFKLMSTKYKIDPKAEHYGCMIDMLCRANQLTDAMRLLRDMPYTPDAVTWTTVLAACRKWKNAELGKMAFEASLSLDDKNSRAYVLFTQAPKSSLPLNKPSI